MIAVAERIYSVPMTSAVDGLAHEVTDKAFAASTTGRFIALCNTEVRPTAGTEPVGRACPACVRVLLVARGLGPERLHVTVPERNRGRARHRRSGRLHTLLARGGRRTR